MAASTKGMLQLRNQATGKLRLEAFTMTPANGEKATFGGTGTTFLLIRKEGEDIVDVYFAGDGVTTCSIFKLLLDGTAININALMSLFAADSNITQRLVVPIGLSGSSQLQMEFAT